MINLGSIAVLAMLTSIPPPPCPESMLRDLPAVNTQGACNFGIVEGETSAGPMSELFRMRLRDCFLDILTHIEAPETMWLINELRQGRLGLLVGESHGRIENVLIAPDFSDLRGERYVLYVEAE